jgi:hypothetical protein
MNINGQLGEQKDFYEPRRTIAEQRFLGRRPETSIDGFISSDYRKKYAIDIRASLSKAFNTNQNGYSVKLAPRYRVNDRMSFEYSFDFSTQKNSVGYVKDVNTNIIIGKRNSEAFENSLSGKYSFSTKSSISLSLRHYWQTVKYNSQYYSLELDGSLKDNPYTGNHNVNYNSWNLDVNYLWEFAPGSQLTAFYRNSIFNANDQADINFINNINDLFHQPALHTFSLKFVYFIDYNNIKNIF